MFFLFLSQNGLRDIQSTYAYDGLENPVSEQTRSQYYTNQTNVTTDYICDYTEEVPTVLSEVWSDGVTVDYTYGNAKRSAKKFNTALFLFTGLNKPIPM